MKKLITLKGMGGLVAVLTATSTQVAHAHWEFESSRVITGTGTAVVDPSGQGHVHPLPNIPRPPASTASMSFPQDGQPSESSKEYIFKWVVGPNEENIVVGGGVRSLFTFSVAGGPLRGSHTSNGGRAVASATLSPSRGLSVDTSEENPDEDSPIAGTQTQELFIDNLLVREEAGVKKITLVVGVNASGQSSLTIGNVGSAKTEFNGLSISIQDLQIPWVDPGPGPGPLPDPGPRQIR